MLMEVMICGWRERPEAKDIDNISSSLVGRADGAAQYRNTVCG
jgi:hypothetical protein